MKSAVEQFIKKSDQWQDEMVELHAILLKSNLEENIKWNLPCYTHEGRNIVIIQPFKASLGLMFFKGTFLKDAKNIMIDNGPNSQSARRLEFGSLQEIKKLAPSIKAYIKEAIALEESGQKVEVKKTTLVLPDELKKMFTKNSELKKAFNALTPGRQRAYVLHFSSAKQSSTRQSRIEKCIPQIMAGKGLNDR
jgi:uncharacterized protein YdeI (YjbR/CyaY-like superfamily)